MKKLKNKKGITLIALVVTIIVLLILAGVTIATLTGENGILTRAQEAKNQTENAEENELRKLTQAEAATHLENYEYTDNSTGEEKIVTIPAGFAVSQVEGENTIKGGLVIIDSKGNEFVWIPVSRKNFDMDFVRRAGYREGVLQDLSNYGEAIATGINTNPEVTESKITQSEATEMYQSVYNNEGFYIGRYEAGKDSNGNVVIQKGSDVYNNVRWSRNGQMDETSEEIANEVDGKSDGAIELARRFDTENEYTTATSTLCYGVQWDATLAWIDSDYTGFPKDSRGKGNYNEDENTGLWKGSIALTGISEDYKVNNIYDLAGNVREWTMESYGKIYRVARGGNYTATGYVSPTSRRDYTLPYYNFDYIGFRITLYL